MTSHLLGSSNSKISQALMQSQVVNEGTEEELACYGYRDSKWKRALFYCLIILTLGFILIVVRWLVQLRVYLTKRRCHLVQADTVLLMNECKDYYVESIEKFSVNDSRLEADILQYSSNKNSSQTLNSIEDGLSDKVKLLQSSSEEFTVSIRYFEHRHVRYLWNHVSWTFSRLEGIHHNSACATLSTAYNGWSCAVQDRRRLFYGPNSIDIAVKSYGRLFVDEVLNPFYIFQVFSVVLWMLDEYYYYAGCIIAISLISIAVSLYETKRQSVTLREKVSSKHSDISVSRGGTDWDTCDSRLLVPGDIISLQIQSCDPLLLPCDAVVLKGNCIVNESMLTGESTPEKKTPLICHTKEEMFDLVSHKRHILFSGTKLLQTSGGDNNAVEALVLRTGFNTTKGDLVRAILFPKPVGFQFYRDSLYFVMFLAVVASFGMLYTVIVLALKHTVVYEIVIRALDIITIAVPPALPAAMTVGTVYAQNRLKRHGIFCISPPRINMCSKIELFCFDKTGTLTEDRLDLWGVVPCTSNVFDDVTKEPQKLGPCTLVSAMASCHSIVSIHGQLCGDPLDIIIFKSIGWVIESSNRYGQFVDTAVTPQSDHLSTEDTSFQTPLEIVTLKEFPFSSELQRMTVVTKSTHNNHFEVFSKGAPEKICSLCLKESVPDNFSEMLHKFTVQGYRVIAMAGKQLKSSSRWHQVLRLPRDEVEKDLHFLGLVILENALKPETQPIITQLSDAKIKTVMVTGDNILTAVSVARRCGMVNHCDQVIEIKATDSDDAGSPVVTWNVVGEASTEVDSQLKLNGRQHHSILVDFPCHFAISGKSFEVIANKCSQSLLYTICVKGAVFARMSPNQKAQLVTTLQELGYFVGMCGDGANDCGALKAAHAGISLSEEEASVASPFTSVNQNIECVPTLIREGRAAMVTSFGCFKYMALYSIIQFMSVMILYWYETNLSDMMYLYEDLFVTTTVAILMGYTAAYHKLVPRRPHSSLASLTNILNIILQIFMTSLFQIAVLVFLINQSWYIRMTPNKKANAVACYEVMVVFIASAYQYIIMAFVFSKGPPFRKRIWSNWMFFLALVVLFSTTTFLLFAPRNMTGLKNFLKIVSFPDNLFKVTLLLLMGINLVLCLSVEYFMEDSLRVKKWMKSLKRKYRPSTRKFKAIEREMCNNSIVLRSNGTLSASIHL